MKRTLSKWRLIARRRWPSREWIAGDGRWATVSLCRGRATVELHSSRYFAHASLTGMLNHGCGSRCRGYAFHYLADLAGERSNTRARSSSPRSAR